MPSSHSFFSKKCLRKTEDQFFWPYSVCRTFSVVNMIPSSPYSRWGSISCSMYAISAPRWRTRARITTYWNTGNSSSMHHACWPPWSLSAACKIRLRNLFLFKWKKCKTQSNMWLQNNTLNWIFYILFMLHIICIADCVAIWWIENLLTAVF